MIEEKNKKILELIEKSSKIAQIVTKDLQKLYASINNESHLN